MFNDIAPEEVDMVALFPEDKDFTQVFAEHPIARHTTPELVEAKRAAAAELAEPQQG